MIDSVRENLSDENMKLAVPPGAEIIKIHGNGWVTFRLEHSGIFLMHCWASDGRFGESITLTG